MKEEKLGDPASDCIGEAPADARGYLHDSSVSNSENRDLPRKAGCLLVAVEEHVHEESVHNASNQLVDTDETAKRNFQRENNGMTDVNIDYENNDPECPEVKNTSLAGNSPQNKKRISSNRNSFQNSEGCKGTENEASLNSISSPGIKCNESSEKGNENEVSMIDSSTVDNVKAAEGEIVNVDSPVEKKYEVVQPGPSEEIETNNVAKRLDSCLNSNKGTSHDAFVMPCQSSRSDVNVNTNFPHFRTEEKVSQSTGGEGFTSISGVAYNPHRVQNDQRIGSFMAQTTLHSHFLYPSHVRGGIDNMFMNFLSVHPMNAVHPFNQGFNFFQTGNMPPYAVSDVQRGLNIQESGAMWNPEYELGRNYLDYTSVERSKVQEKEVPYLSTHYNINCIRPSSLSHAHEQKPVHPLNALNPFYQGLNFFQTGNMPPYAVSDAHHGLNIRESGVMWNPEYELGRNKLQEKEVAYLSTSYNVNCTSPSSLSHAYEQKPPITLSPRLSFTGFRKKKLLILDLNGLLADINQDYHNSHMANAKVRGKLVFRRPYCHDFLSFCLQNFELGIWSSRKKKNVDSVIDVLMKDFKPFLLFCWDMSKCTFTGHKTLENIHKPLVLKELRKLWDKEEPDLPWEKGHYSPSNTLLVDDSPYKALRNPPHTAIFPRPYSYFDLNDRSLGPGGNLRVYLENLAAAEDVECYVRNNPFGQPFITQSDPDWSFYAQIVEENGS